MTQDEQNAIDLERVRSKRARALTALDEYMKWVYPSPMRLSEGVQCLHSVYKRNITHGTEDDVDRLIKWYEESNEMSLFQKITEDL